MSKKNTRRHTHRNHAVAYLHEAPVVSYERSTPEPKYPEPTIVYLDEEEPEHSKGAYEGNSYDKGTHQTTVSESLAELVDQVADYAKKTTYFTKNKIAGLYKKLLPSEKSAPSPKSAPLSVEGDETSENSTPEASIESPTQVSAGYYLQQQARERRQRVLNEVYAENAARSEAPASKPAEPVEVAPESNKVLDALYRKNNIVSQRLPSSNIPAIEYLARIYKKSNQEEDDSKGLLDKLDSGITALKNHFQNMKMIGGFVGKILDYVHDALLIWMVFGDKLKLMLQNFLDEWWPGIKEDLKQLFNATIVEWWHGTEFYKKTHPFETGRFVQRNARVTEVHDETSGNLTGTIVAVPNMGGSLSYSYVPVRRGPVTVNPEPQVWSSYDQAPAFNRTREEAQWSPSYPSLNPDEGRPDLSSTPIGIQAASAGSTNIDNSSTNLSYINIYNWRAEHSF